jgi:hypothetical protein
MNFFCNVQDHISAPLIREISVQIMEMHSREFAEGGPQDGICLFDNQGIAILAEDKGRKPGVFCFSIPAPLTIDAGRDLLSLCEETCDRLGLDKTDPGKMLPSLYDLLKELIDNELATSNISNIIGAYHVQNLFDVGVNLEEQATLNQNLALRRNIEAKFTIIKNSKLIRFNDDIGPRARLGRTL